MQFLEESAEQAITAFSKLVVSHLQTGERVLWLTCGGSAIPAEAKMMDVIRNQASEQLGNLTILAGDDRYGSPGHADSNYKQLQNAGFDAGSATWHDVLENDVPLEETVEYYTALLQDAQVTADFTVGVFGVGADGHTAGVKPGSPAIQDDQAAVVGYEWDDFVRMTLTPQELIKADAAFVLAYGNEKRPVLERLRAGTEPVDTLPCNLLSKIPVVYVYNDQISTKEKE